MPKAINLIGNQYGRLVVISRLPMYKHKLTYYFCICNCGKNTIVAGGSLKYNKTKSCGCYAIDKAKKRNTTHGLSHTKIHRVWEGMKQRCYYSKSKSYKNYGGRGIFICDEWLNDFELFYKWCVENNYNEGLHIDRIDNDKGYMPSNCRFVKPTQNNTNKRNTIYVEFKGEKVTLLSLSEKYNINYDTLWHRINSGQSVLDAVNRIVKYNKRKYRFNGKTLNLKELASETGIKYKTLHKRINEGWTLDRAINQVVKKRS